MLKSPTAGRDGSFVGQDRYSLWRQRRPGDSHVISLNLEKSHVAHSACWFGSPPHLGSPPPTFQPPRLQFVGICSSAGKGDVRPSTRLSGNYWAVATWCPNRCFGGGLLSCIIGVVRVGITKPNASRQQQEIVAHTNSFVGFALFPLLDAWE